MNREELLKKAKPILFNTKMVEAILKGRKTVTRRVVKLDLGLADTDKNDSSYLRIPDGYGDYHDAKDLCRYRVGDILYIREKFNETETNSVLWASDKEFIDFGCKEVDGYLFMESEIKWKPSIHMPKDLARIFLKVTDVRVERLRDITEEQARKEGISSYWAEPHRDVPPFIGVEKDSDFRLCRTRCKAFQSLWNSTIKKQDLDKYGWEANPFVWVIEFERVGI